MESLLRSLWWWERPRLAGMARPGLNDLRWEELSFAEAVLVGWLGTQERAKITTAQLQAHVLNYGPKIQRFYLHRGAGHPDVLASVASAMERPEDLRRVLIGLQRREFLGAFALQERHLEVELSAVRLRREVEVLKRLGLECLVCLTEQCRNQETLERHFEVHHLPIPDVGVPTLTQVGQLAKLLESHPQRPTAVYCMAGLGRTSIMLMAAHMRRGWALEDAIAHVRKANPGFVLAGKQEEFIRALPAAWRS